LSRGGRFVWTTCIVWTLLTGGCASLPKDVDRPLSHFIQETSDTRLGRELRPLVENHPGLSGFHALIAGIDAFAVRLLLIQQAEKTLDLQYYIWHDDLTGKILYNQLMAAADRGVRVRLLLDDLDTAGKDDMLHLIDSHPNIEIRVFNPFANRHRRAVDVLGELHRINHRMHNKSLTADNQATVFGGRNIGDEYFNATEEVGFSDLDVLVIGAVVPEVSEEFDLYWNSPQVYPLSAFKEEERVDDARVRAFRRQSDAFVKTAQASPYADAVRALVTAERPSIATLDYSWGKWKLVYDRPGKVGAREVKKETHVAPAIKEGMDRTESELIIVSPYFVPGSGFTEYLTGLTQRGVAVRIMTNSLAANDVPVVHAGYMRYRKDLINGGVELYEYKAMQGNSGGKKKDQTGWSGSSHASLHGKYFGFDRRYVFVGSFNLDARSVDLNTEMGVYFESPQYAEMLSEGFGQRAMTKGYRVILNGNGDLEWVTLENGREVRIDHEPETGFWERFSTGFLSIFVPEGQL
jgi:cardiolipin synthase C